MKINSYYVEELGLSFPSLNEAEQALAEEIKKDGWDLEFIIRVDDQYCYCGSSIKPRKCPYSVPGYTIIEKKINVE